MPPGSWPEEPEEVKPFEEPRKRPVKSMRKEVTITLKFYYYL